MNFSNCMPMLNTAGIDFDNVNKIENNFFPINYVFNEENNIKVPISDGTTILGIIYKDGVMLACDTRTSSGNFVSHKCARKINRINENVYICRCGTSSDSQKLIEYVKYLSEVSKGENRKRGRLITKAQREPDIWTDIEEVAGDFIDNIPECENFITKNRTFYSDQTLSYSPLVKHIASLARNILYEYRAYFNCALIVGGYDSKEKQQLYSVYVNGSIIKRDTFITAGSGSAYITSYLQDKYKKNMSKKECFNLIIDCVKYAIHNDNKSGGIVRVVILTKKYLEEYAITHMKLEVNH